MALNYLSIPGKITYIYVIINLTYSVATSVDVERAFSQGRLILSHVRSRLSVQSTRALMCLGGWSKLGYVKDGDIKGVIAGLAEIPEGKEEPQLEKDWDIIS